MHIIGGRAELQTQHVLTHSEQRTSLRQQPVNANIALPAARRLQQSSSASIDSRPTAGESATGNKEDFSLFKALVEALIGKHIDTLDLTSGAPQLKTNTTPPTASGGSVLSIDTRQISETEITQVATSGQFNTDDGGAISVNLQYVLERHYASSSTTISISDNRPAKDPLVVNFDGRGAALNRLPTAFDLNNDGRVEALPTLAAGSAYLALDRNGDGNIDNGSELFGPTSNDGYAELSQFDSDGNGFIDSADPIFDKLRLFRPGEQSQTLADRDIGAVFLGSVVSPARLTDNNNLSLGQLRATGFYLTNSGGASLVQELDLAV